MVLNKSYIFIIFILILLFICKQYKQNGGALNKIIVKTKVGAATTAPVNIRYANSELTLSNNIIDNYNLNKDDLILIKNQTNYQENGIYKIIDISNPRFILIEKQFNNNIKNTVYIIQNGLLNKNTQWNIYNDIYKKYYNSLDYLFKLSNITNNTYEKNFILKSKLWIDSSTILFFSTIWSFLLSYICWNHSILP